MQRQWHPWVRSLAATSTLAGLLLAGGGLMAQTPAPGGPAAPGAPASPVVPPAETPPDESVTLISGPKGLAFRLVEQSGDQRRGGGGLTLAAPGPNDTWTPLLQIFPKEPGVSARDGRVAFGPGGEIALVYRWWGHSPRTKQLRVVVSRDGGRTWSQPTTQIDGVGKAFDPKLAWLGAKGLVVVWGDERRGNRLFDVYARRSLDGGRTWDAEQMLSRFPKIGPNDLHTRPHVLSDGDRVWVLWLGLRGMTSHLFMNRSTDGGRTWSDPALVTADSRSVFGETLLRVDKHMLLVWHDAGGGQPDRIYASTSSDDGATWTAPVRVDHLPDGGPAAASSSVLLGEDGEALVAWQDARNAREDIFLSRSADWGRTWAKEDQRMDMDEPGTAISRFPRLAKAPDGRVALAWEDDRAGHEAVYLRVRSAGERPVWGPEILVAPSTQRVAARVPTLAWGQRDVHVLWHVWDHTLGVSSVSKRVAGRTLSLKP